MLRRATKRRSAHESSDTDAPRSDVVVGYVYDQRRVPAIGEDAAKDEETQALEQHVLGDGSDILKEIEQKSGKHKKKKLEEIGEPDAAWEDDDDSKVTVQITNKHAKQRQFKHNEGQTLSGEAYTQKLKDQFKKTTGQPEWAKLKWQKSDDEGDSEDDSDVKDLLQRTGNYLAQSEALPQGTLQIKKCTDANADCLQKSKVKAMEFHSSAQVLLTGGSSQTLALFQVDGKHNPKIQSIFLDNFPITCAHFTRDGTEVVISSIHKQFKYYDMIGGCVVDVPKIKALEETKLNRFVMSPCGKFIAFLGTFGRIHLISATTKEWIQSLKMNGSVEAVTFSPDGLKMFSHGDDGVVYVWDMTTRDCVHSFTDEGCLAGTSLAVSHNGQLIAAGSSSGVVNVYDSSCLTSKIPKPQKAIMNLTTPCTHLQFNSTDEILAAASNQARCAIKLVHVPSLTTFSNFPNNDARLRVPCVVDFSINSGYFAVGNNAGNVLLYRLKHYHNY